MNKKNEKFYKSISEVAKLLDMVNKKNGKLNTHTLRFWEKKFKQIKPTVKAGNRRYYSKHDLQIIKKVKFLLKDKGLTIKGVKQLLNNKNVNELDDYEVLGVNTNKVKNNNEIKVKLNNILKIIKELKDLKNG